MRGSVDRRHISDLLLLRLWWRPAATASMRPLVWEPPWAAGAAPKRPKKKKILLQAVTCYCLSKISVTMCALGTVSEASRIDFSPPPSGAWWQPTLQTLGDHCILAVIQVSKGFSLCGRLSAQGQGQLTCPETFSVLE